MGNKEVKIVAPEGYEIDNEESTLEKIVFKKKDDKPRSWEKFCYSRDNSNLEAYYIDDLGVVKHTNNAGCFCPALMSSKEEAEAFVALMQLRQLRKAWVGDWEPDWKGYNTKGIIEYYSDNIRVASYSHIHKTLSFPTEEMAIEFFDCFKGLLEQAKILL